MKMNLRLLLERRKVPPHIWCYNNRIPGAKELAEFLFKNNMFVDRPLEEWMSSPATPNLPVEEMEILAPSAPPVPTEEEPEPEVTESSQPEEPQPEKAPKRTSKKPKTPEA